jgi:hypothetical protein
MVAIAVETMCGNEQEWEMGCYVEKGKGEGGEEVAMCKVCIYVLLRYDDAWIRCAELHRDMLRSGQVGPEGGATKRVLSLRATREMAMMRRNLQPGRL